jgi:hypothetical protein
MKQLRFAYRFFALLDRDAALDSLRNVLAILGLGTFLADFSTMRYWLIAPALGLAFLVWLIDYLRHDFDTVEIARAEHCAKELQL